MRTSRIAAVRCLLIVCSWLVSTELYAAESGFTRRFIVAVGSDLGVQGESKLTYAERDAEELVRLMKELGDTRPEDVVLLKTPTPATFEEALASVERKLDERSMLIVYYSGHGSGRQLHLAGHRLARRELDRWIARSRAALKVLIIDACREGATAKGFRLADVLPIDPQPQPAYKGLVVINSARWGETAYELPGLRGGVFSYFFRNGLRGPADGDHDGRVSLIEAYEYAYNHTRSTAAVVLNGQTPELIMGSEGHGPLILTRLSPSSSRLILPPGDNVHYVVFDKGTDQEFADGWGKAASTTEIALPAGQFIVHRTTDATHTVAEVTLPFGGVRSLTLDSFAGAGDEAEWSRRGGGAALFPWQVSLALGLHVDGASRLGETVALRASLGSSGFVPCAALYGTRDVFTTRTNDVRENALTLAFGYEYQALFASLNAHAALLLGASIIRQDSSSRLSSATESATALAGVAELRAGLALPLSPRLAWDVTAAVSVDVHEEQAHADPYPVLEVMGTATTGIAVSF